VLGNVPNLSPVMAGLDPATQPDAQRAWPPLHRLMAVPLPRCAGEDPSRQLRVP
jgi:hypothetical protein